MNISRPARISGMLASLVVVGGLLACSGDDGTDADATTTTTADATGTVTRTVTDTVTDAPPPGTDNPDNPGDGDNPGTEDPAPPPQGPPEDTMPGPGTQLDITEVRAGTHDGYDRIVLEMDGTGTPGSVLRLTENPTADGSGFPVEYTGEQALTVAVHGITYNGVEPSVSGIPAGSVASVKAMGAFEGTQLIVIGLTDGDITLDDISATTLDSPTRLVIDIRR
ncbi:MAG: hypothetical protein L0L26_05630 [Corynebacterium variabile]|uniref:AMIN-like domain-containing (lipo)protein n=1 Tax=Corynebacterium variabile TaxID=1727 RepID=UPI0026470A74|nr:hypothetical protein [Corynebacterium variabile]MDN6661329.1 hypothetical protein [Corynebacterium variabile]